MSFREAFQHVVKVLRADRDLQTFLPAQAVIIGDRKHDDPLQPYVVRVMPSGEQEPRETATFDSSTRRRSPTSAGTRLARYHIFLSMQCAIEDPEVRILGLTNDRVRAPGILDFVGRVKDALERDWRFKKSVLAMEWEVVSFIESFPPAKADVIVFFEEEILKEARRVDPYLEVINQQVVAS